MGDRMIPGLMPGNCSETICVRASRFWDFYDPHDETKLWHSDLVLIDEEGNCIHAQIYPPDDKQFKPLIKEGNVYNLSYFRVRRSGKFRPVDNDHMINFTRWTSVEEVVETPPAFPMYTYSLAPMEQLPLRAEDTAFFTDVIGVVTMLSNVSSMRIRSRQNESLKRTVTICNASGASLDVVLWGERATSFPAEQVHRDGKTTPQTVIFVGTLVKSYGDNNVSLSGGSACKWYINLEVPEAKALTASNVANTYQPVKWDEHKTSNEPVAFTAPEHKKVSDIKMLHPFKFKKTEWLVTVTVQKIDKSWWYNACKKCLKTAKPYLDSFRCSERKCGTVGAPIPRYKLCITAGDETGETEFVIFGRIAQRLTRKPVDTLIADNPTGFIPNEVTKLLEKVFVWNASFTENTIATGIVSFQVNSVVTQLDGDSALSMTPTSSQSSSLMLSKDASSSMQNTPQKSFASALSLPPATSAASHASSATPVKMPPLISGAPATPESCSNAAKDENAIHEVNILALASATATPNPTDALTILLNSPATKAIVGSSINKDVPDNSETKTQTNVNKKRTRSAPKRSAKKLFPDGSTMDDSSDGCVDGTAAAEPSAATGDN